MAKLVVPIQINLPDDWVEQIVDRLRNDPDADWAEITRCKNCKKRIDDCGFCTEWDYDTEPDDYCSKAERREDD